MHEQEYHVASHRAGISCPIPNSELGYYVPSQIPSWGTVYHFRACIGVFWAKIWDRGPGFGPLGHCRLSAVSNRGPKFEP
jgi:hypothetical protein